MTAFRKRVLWVTGASATDTALSFLVPIVLARLVPVEQFGEYRFFWLVVMTAVTFAPLGIEQALVYFLFRSPQKRLQVVGNTLVYFGLVAVGVALIVAPWNDFVSQRLGMGNQLLLAAFCFLYLTSLSLDYLPLASERPGIYARNVAVTAAARVACVIVPALVTGQIEGAFYGLLLFAMLRLALLGSFLKVQYRRVLFPVDRGLIGQQLAYGFPFGISGACYTFRSQGEQWIASALFRIQDFAIFSVGSLVVQLLQVLQQPVFRVLQPRMHSLAAEGHLDRAHQLNRRANVVVGFVTYPLIIFLFVFADPIVALLLPPDYGAAAGVMRIYLLGQFRLAQEGSSLLQVVGDGRYAMRLSGLLLAPALLLSVFAARNWGLAATAAGSVVAGLLETAFVQRRLTERLGVPFSAIQDWGTHARLLVTALGANAASLIVTYLLPAGISPVLLLLVAAAAVAATCILLAAPMGLTGLAREVLAWRRVQAG